MSTLDSIIVAIAGITTIFGIWKGLVKQVFSIIGVIGGYLVARAFYHDLAAHLIFMDQAAAKIVGFASLFIGVIVSAFLVGLLMEKVLRLPGLGFINRLAGGIFGFAKGFLIVALIVMALLIIMPSNSPVFSHSATIPYVLKGIQLIDKVIPQDIKNNYHKKLDDIKAKVFKETVKRS